MVKIYLHLEVNGKVKSTRH